MKTSRKAVAGTITVLLVLTCSLSGCKIPAVDAWYEIIFPPSRSFLGNTPQATSDIATPATYNEVYTSIGENLARVASSYDSADGGLPDVIYDAVPEADAQKSQEPAPSAPAPTSPDAPSATTTPGQSEPSAGVAPSNTSEAMPLLDSSDTASGALGLSDTSTNTQVAGVDEADIVKTDGQNLYIVNDSRVRIVSANGNDSEELARVDVPIRSLDMPRGISDLYVQNQRMVALFSTGENGYLNPDGGDYIPPTTIAQAALYDISDPSDPQLLEVLGQEGELVTSRLHQGILYLLSEYQIYNFQSIQPGAAESYVPSLYEDDSSQGCIPLEDIRIMPQYDYPRYSVISSINLDKAERIDQLAVLGGNSEQYMSNTSLYTVCSNYLDRAESRALAEGVARLDSYSGSWARITRFGLSQGDIELVASAFLPGQTDSQFSLDEYQDNLRIALSLSGLYGPGTSSNANDLYILDSDLQVVGGITDLAPGESIKSVRFDGQVGYVVTFRQTDPLFSIDLSDPRYPKVMDALKIPGFSEYLHPWADGRLLGFGMNGDDFGLTQGLKLSMFDTSDPYNLTEMTSAAVSNGTSDALYNHKAILVDPARGIIGFVSQEYLSVAPLEDNYDDGRGWGNSLNGENPADSASASADSSTDDGGSSDSSADDSGSSASSAANGSDASGAGASDSSASSSDVNSTSPARPSNSAAVSPSYWSGSELVSNYLIYHFDEDHGFSKVGSLPVSSLSAWARGLFVGDYFYLCQANSVVVCDPTSFKALLTV